MIESRYDQDAKRMIKAILAAVFILSNVVYGSNKIQYIGMSKNLARVVSVRDSAAVRQDD
jgi:hypothetical protein